MPFSGLVKHRPRSGEIPDIMTDPVRNAQQKYLELPASLITWWPAPPQPSRPAGARLVTRIFWILTALTTGFGVPLWFGLLQQLTNVRPAPERPLDDGPMTLSAPCPS
jgi:hypothetical protein